MSASNNYAETHPTYCVEHPSGRQAAGTGLIHYLPGRMTVAPVVAVILTFFEFFTWTVLTIK